MLADASIGWVIIAAMCAAFYFGVTKVVYIVAKSVDEAVIERPNERDRV